MPSYVQGLGTGCKILTRTASGMKTNMMLLAPEGGVEAVVECKRLTGVRNAAGEHQASKRWTWRTGLGKLGSGGS